MTEDRLSSLIKEFADPIAAVRQPMVRARRRPVFRWAMVGAGAFAVVIGAFLLMPRTAAANAFARVQAAITNAKTMTATLTVFDNRPESGKPFVTVRYRDGMWRTDVLPGLKREAHLIQRDGFLYTYLPNIQVVTKRIPEERDRTPAGDMSAVEFAREQVDMGSSEDVKSVKTLAHAPVDGREAYSVIVDHSPSKVHAEILVDKKTDLPIHAEMTMINDGPRYKGMRQRVVVDYRFNESVDAEAFNPQQFGQPIHDLHRERAELAERWGKAVEVPGGGKILHAWQDEQGQIYIACAVDESGNGMVATKVTDEHGVRYVRPADTSSLGSSSWVDGRTIEVCSFVPIEPILGGRSGSFTVTFRPNDGPSPDTNHQPRSGSITLSSLPVESTNPTGQMSLDHLDYANGVLTALDLNTGKIQYDTRLDAARADWYKGRHKYNDELRWRWAAYHKQEEDLPRGARMFYAPPIVDCLRRLGRNSEADEVMAKFGEPKFKVSP